MGNQLLNTKAINRIYSYCLADDTDRPSMCKVVNIEGEAVVFNKERLYERAFVIWLMLFQLNDSFFLTKNPFGNCLTKADKDRHGRTWASDLSCVKELISLGIATDRAVALPQSLEQTNIIIDT